MQTVKGELQYTLYSQDEARLLPFWLSPVSIPEYGIEVAKLELEFIRETPWIKYLLSCLSTWMVDAPIYQIGHSAVGIISEIPEFIETPSVDEMGDIFYYRTVFLYLWGMSLELETTERIDSPNKAIQLLAGIAKNVSFTNRLLKAREKVSLAKTYLDGWILSQLEQHDLLVSDIQQQNLDKLAKRHPNKKFNQNY